MLVSNRRISGSCACIFGLIYVTSYFANRFDLKISVLQNAVPAPVVVKSTNINVSPGTHTSSQQASSHAVGLSDDGLGDDDQDDDILTIIDDIVASGTRGFDKSGVHAKDTGNVSCSGVDTFKGVEDLLCKKPATFLPSYKNPCWQQDGAFVCLPYFQLIGMGKCGTTDLFDRMLLHPDILPNEGLLNKETLWWSGKRYGHYIEKSHPRETFDRYLEYFSSAARKIRQNATISFITGDGSPRDMFDMSGWVKTPQNQGLPEPRFLTPHLIRHVNPGVKLLVILRDPVERLYSDFYFRGRGRLTPQGFDEAVRTSIALLGECIQTSSLRACVYNRTVMVALNERGKTRLHMGLYSINLRDWLSVFPRQQVLTLIAEVFHKDVANHMQRIFQFLDIRRLTEQELEKIVSLRPARVTSAKKKAKPMLESTRVLLKRLYQPFNVDLAAILNNTDYLWS